MTEHQSTYAVTIDQTTDADDTDYAARACCECGWQGRWHRSEDHGYRARDAYALAIADAAAHRVVTADAVGTVVEVYRADDLIGWVERTGADSFTAHVPTDGTLRQTRALAGTFASADHARSAILAQSHAYRAGL